MADQERPYNIALHYFDVATSARNFPAIIGRDFALSHHDLAQVIRGVAMHLARTNVDRGSLVALNSTNTVAILSTLFATALLGSRFCIASPTLARFKTVVPTHFLRTPEVAGHPAVPFQVLEAELFSPVSGGADGTDYTPSPPTDPWMFLHTSGTTGAPKFITLSQQMVRDRSAAVADDFPARATTFATFFPPTSRPFFARAIAALLQGCSIVEGIDTDHWLASGVNFVSASPSHMTKMMTGRRLPRKIERLEVSGSKIPPMAAKHYLESFDTVIDVYGASETSKSFSNKLELDATGEVVARGLPRDSEVEIVDDNLHPRKPGELGTVRVRNTYMVDGYVNAPDATQKAFRDGWFYPGDIGCWGPNGDLDILGRDDEVLNVGGYKMQASLADFVVRSVEGVSDAVVFPNPLPNAADPFLAFVVFEEANGRHSISETIIEAFTRAFGFGLSLRNIKPVTDYPRDENGSPDRSACARMVLARARDLGELA